MKSAFQIVDCFVLCFKCQIELYHQYIERHSHVQCKFITFQFITKRHRFDLNSQRERINIYLYEQLENPVQISKEKPTTHTLNIYYSRVWRPFSSLPLPIARSSFIVFLPHLPRHILCACE